MAHKVKCVICGGQFDRDKEQSTKKGARYCHQACYPEGELVPIPVSIKKGEDPDLKALKDYIQQLYKDKANWVLITKQIKDYHANDNFTYSGMLSTLKYFYEVKKGDPNASNGGIGIVKYTYQDAYNYYLKLFLANQANQGKNIKSFIPKEQVVVIQAPRSTMPKIKMFDMDWEEDEE